MKNAWIMAAALVLVLVAAGYTIAQSTSGAQGGMMGSGMMNMMMGRPVSPEELEQFAKQHGITVEQAKQMTDQCHQMMGTTTTPGTPKL